MRKRWCAGLILAATAAACAGPSATQSTQTMDVREFASQIYIQGLPIEEALRYGPEAVPILSSMLSDTNEQAYWSNAAIMLGVIGDQVAVDRLLQFIDAPRQAQLSADEFRAVTGAIVSLGYAVNRTKNETALAFLKQAVDPSFWAQRVRWRSPFQESEEARNFQLSTSAVLGLGLTGHPSAAETLRSLQTQAATDVAKRFQEQARDTIAEALKTNEVIASAGLVGYYRSAKR